MFLCSLAVHRIQLAAQHCHYKPIYRHLSMHRVSINFIQSNSTSPAMRRCSGRTLWDFKWTTNQEKRRREENEVKSIRWKNLLHVKCLYYILLFHFIYKISIRYLVDGMCLRCIENFQIRRFHFTLVFAHGNLLDTRNWNYCCTTHTAGSILPILFVRTALQRIPAVKIIRNIKQQP